METVTYELVKGEIDYDMLLFSQFCNEVVCSYPLTPPNNLVLFLVITRAPLTLVYFQPLFTLSH